MVCYITPWKNAPPNVGLCAQGEANLEEVIPWALGRNQNWLAGWNSLFDNKNGQSRGYVLHCMTNNDDQMAVARAMNCALISKRFL